RSDAPELRLCHPQSAGIALAPHHPLGIRRNQLAMTIEDLAIASDRDVRVVDRAAAELAVALVDAAHRDDASPGARFTERSEPVGREIHAVVEQVRVDP